MHISSLVVLVVAGNVFSYAPEGENAQKNTGYDLPPRVRDANSNTESTSFTQPLNRTTEHRPSHVAEDDARDSSGPDGSSKSRGQIPDDSMQPDTHDKAPQKDVRNSEFRHRGHNSESIVYRTDNLFSSTLRTADMEIGVLSPSNADGIVKDDSTDKDKELELVVNDRNHLNNGPSKVNFPSPKSSPIFLDVSPNGNMSQNISLLSSADTNLVRHNVESSRIVSNEKVNSFKLHLPKKVDETTHKNIDRKSDSLKSDTRTSQKGISATNGPLSSAEDIVKRWKELENAWKVKTDSILKKALPKLLEYKTRVNVSSHCKYAMMHLVSGLRGLKSWAVKMVDASGSLPSGSLEGTFTDLGDYDQCLDIVHRLNRGPIRQLRGQYCTLELKPLLPALEGKATLHTKVLDFGNSSKDSVLSDLSHSSALFHIMVLRIGVCTPSVCSEDDIRALTDLAVGRLPVQVTARNCEVKTSFRLSASQVTVLCFAITIILLMFAGTAVDFYTTRTIIKPVEISRLLLSITAFSITTNVKNLMKKPKSGSSTLGAVNGIRCLSLVWIVLAHTYGFGHRQGLAHLSHARMYMEDVPFQIITNAWVSVDTFFMLGGLLVSISNLRSLDQNDGKMDLIHYVLHRIWRLTPPVAATVGVMFLLPLIGSGPLWADMVGQKVANCERGWWQAILPINTWLEFDSMCLLHTWYVSADIHFYCLAPLVLIPLYKWPVIGFLVLIFMTTVTAVISGVLTLLHNLPPTVIFFSPDVEMTKKTANLLYFRPYPHMGAYCVGLVLGYFLWKHKKSSLNWAIQTTGWMLSSVSCLSVLFATYPWSKGHVADPASCVAYAMTHRTVWAAGVAWVIYICATGRAGVLNQFLSSQFFVPLSRLCYSVYLLHFPVLWVRVSWRRSLLNFHHYDVVTEFFGILIITLLLSVIFHIAFEAPFLKLEEVWFPKKKTSLLPTNKDDEKCNT